MMHIGRASGHLCLEQWFLTGLMEGYFTFKQLQRASVWRHFGGLTVGEVLLASSGRVQGCD